MSHVPDDCPAVRAQGEHNFCAWTTQAKAGVPMLWRHCFECDREEWEFDQPGEVSA